MENFVVFDLETQRSADQVGGWGNIDKMLFSVAVLWDSEKKNFFTYYENQLQELVDHLFLSDKIIGFNHLQFDYKVLAGCFKETSKRIEFETTIFKKKNLDLLIDTKTKIGYRVKLNNFASSTIQTEKSADGTDALVWYQQYQESGDKKILQKISDYCRQDVKVTRDLYLYGCKEGYVKYTEKDSSLKKIQVEWHNAETPFQSQAVSPSIPTLF